MTHSMNLRDLATGKPVAPPFGFEEFARRRAAGEHRRRAGVWGIATSVSVLGLVALLALMTQAPLPATLVTSGSPVLPVDLPDVPYQPALVDLGQFTMTSDLQDHIALLDAQISAARVYAAPPERLRQLESTRAQLNDSLQRVSYAQTLLSF